MLQVAGAIKNTTARTWPELIEDVVGTIAFDGSGVRTLSNEFSVDGEVVLATVASRLMHQALKDGLISQGDIREMPDTQSLPI
jgi:hypothetical protein